MKSNLFENSIFVIDRDNCDSIQSHLYGFSFINQTAYVNCDLPKNCQIAGSPGAYIAVLDQESTVDIIQDSLSTFLLFVYQDEDYFCLSNSFYALCEYVSSGRALSLNRTYANQYLSTNMASLAPRNTLANEISIVPLFSTVTIDKTNRSLRISEAPTPFESVHIDSRQGMNILDEWLAKWGGLINAAYQAKFPFQIDLSGGYDSRTILSLAYASEIDFNAENVNVYSLNPKTEGQKQHYADDFEIATRISELLGFNLNANPALSGTVEVSGEYAYEVFKSSFLGFHKEGYFEKKVFQTPHFHLGGFNGEPVRGKVRSLEKWLDMTQNPLGVPFDVYQELISDYERTMEQSSSEFECLRKFYLSTWGRNHYGQLVFRDLLLGRIALSPFSDVDLFKLKFPDEIDKDAIFALIIQRTCPQLMEIPYAKGSDFSPKTKEYVKYLCKIYPSDRSDGFPSADVNTFRTINAVPCRRETTRSSGEEHLFMLFKEPSNKELFCKEFGRYGERLYAYAENYFNNKELFFYNQWCVAIVGIIEFLKIRDRNEQKKWLNYFQDASSKYPNAKKLKAAIAELQKDVTARFDIKNIGLNNDILVEDCSDKYAEIRKPSWFLDSSGVGTVIESAQQSIKLVLRCIGDGELKIVLRAKDIRDENGVRVPLFVCYNEFSLNETVFFDVPRDISHDKPYLITLSVKNGDIVTLSSKWTAAEQLH